jgi:GNAT superfamily N-acetyltransferase
MCAGDVDGVVQVAASAFPHHFEARGCFEERLALFPQGCFGLASAGGLHGYLIAYPQSVGSIPPLNSLLGRLPNTREDVYLHDLALHPDVRGQGFARPILERLFEAAALWGTRRVHLVAVNDSVAFWRAMGFDPVTGDPSIARKLQSYSDTSTYMIRQVRPAPR